MLLGEHAVLHGRRALVAAVDRRITVTAAPRPDRRILIRSALGEYHGTLDRLPESPPFRFLLAIIRDAAARRPQGIELTIESDVSDQVGLGSSAAVAVAATATLRALEGPPLSRAALHEACLATIRKVQGAGSGSDVAASVFGGVVEYRWEPRSIRPLVGIPPIVLMYSGFKTPTPDVIRKVEEKRAADPTRYERIFDRMDESVGRAAACIERGDWAECGRIFNENHSHMRELGVSNRELDEIQALLVGQPEVHGAKISGSGMGDCVVALGTTHIRHSGYPLIPAAVSTRGVELEQT
jgi:mevalonate kinase